jgi:AcrR family transcriptional regulator
VKEAWRLASRDGVGAISLGDLAKAVGLRQPSLYTYFESKMDLYDEMFADGYRRFLDEVVSADYPDDAREALTLFVKRCVDFGSQHPARHHLLFQRHIPAFEPSPESFALAEEFYEYFRALMGRAGVKRQQDLDIFASLAQGLSDQQVANDPGGDRWARLAPVVVEMFFSYMLDEKRARTPKRRER